MISWQAIKKPSRSESDIIDWGVWVWPVIIHYEWVMSGESSFHAYCFWLCQTGETLSLLVPLHLSPPTTHPPIHPPASSTLLLVQNESSTLSIWREQEVDAMLPWVPAVHSPDVKSHDFPELCSDLKFWFVPAVQRLFFKRDRINGEVCITVPACLVQTAGKPQGKTTAV